jgi:hypothetical protein
VLEFEERSAEEVAEYLNGGIPPDYVRVRKPDGTDLPLVVICKARTPEDVRIRNVATNIKRPIQRFLNLPHLLRERRQSHIALVGGGPSVALYLDKIREFDNVMACGSPHDYLMDQGIVPTYALCTDPAESTIRFYQKRSPDTLYMLASQCDPSMFEWLADYPVAMWHFKGQVGTMETEHEFFGGEETMNWGCMVGVNAIQMALMLGYQYLHFFGYDCSFTGKTHAYDLEEWETTEVNESRTIATIGDDPSNQKQFSTSTAMITQCCQIFSVFESPDGRFLKGYVYGDGMFANVVKKSPPEMKNWLEAVDATE